jgi:O-antigen ligase
VSVHEVPAQGRLIGGLVPQSRRRAIRPLSGSQTRPVQSPAAIWGKRLSLLSAAVWAAGLAIGFERSLLALTLVGFAAAIVGVARPALGLLGVGMLCTLDSISRAYLLTGGLWRWNTFNYWLLVVMLLSLPFLLHLRDLQTRLLQGMLLLLIIGLAFSADPRTGLQDVLNVVTLFGIMVYFARSERSREIWYWTAVVCGSLAGTGGLVYYLKREGLLEINANAWSFFPLTAIFAITLSFSVTGPRRGRLLLAMLAAVNAVWVFLSGSRGSFLITLVCLIFIAVQMRKSGRALPILAGALLIALGIASQFVERQSEAVHRFDKLLDSRRSWTSRTSGRSDLALGGWYSFQQHPLGIGTGGFGIAWVNLRQREGMSVFREGVYTPAHSGWIKILTENGVPGILLFSAFVLSFAGIGWRRRREGMFLLGLLVTLSLSVAFLADEFQGKGLWFLAAAVMTVMRRRPRLGQKSATPGTASSEVDRQAGVLAPPPRRPVEGTWAS